MTDSQRFLFLQGVRSPFFRKLACAIRAAGHYVRKVNFTIGDTIYWRIGNTVAYRGSMANLKAFYRQEFDTHRITDIVIFGDCRPVHRPAIELANQLGVRIHVYEEGYFRPFWITLERDGVNAHSRLPKDPEWYGVQARTLPHFGNGTPFEAPFWKRAAYDVGYNFWAGLNPILHHGVESHVPYTPIREYLGYLRRGIRVKCVAMKSRRLESRLISESAIYPYYLFPLQLDSDAQIVHHSPYESMADALSEVIVSFAKFALPHARLAVKIHPLDPGLKKYEDFLKQEASHLGVSDRVFYLESGNLPALLSHASGVITVNSTVGGSALIHGKPTIALGHAIYNIAGLTFQGSLDNFWHDASPPDMKLFHNFRDTVIYLTQLNGGFYSMRAIAMAVENSIPRLLSPNEHLTTSQAMHKKTVGAARSPK